MPEAKTQLPLARRADVLPAILAPEEVARFLNAVEGLKYRAALTTIYAAGLRVSETVSLTVRDIDSARTVIHVRQGKGRKDRFVMLSERLLAILRAYWKRERPKDWLFSGPDPTRPITRALAATRLSRRRRGPEPYYRLDPRGGGATGFPKRRLAIVRLNILSLGKGGARAR